MYWSLSIKHMSPLRVGNVDLAECSLRTHEVLSSVLSPVLPASMFLCKILWFKALNIFLRSEGHTTVLQMTKQICLSMELVSKAKLLFEEPFGKCSLFSMCLYSQTKVLTRTKMHLRPSGGHQLDSLVCETLTSSRDSGYITSFSIIFLTRERCQLCRVWGFLGPATWRGTPVKQQQKRPGYWSKSRAG